MGKYLVALVFAGAIAAGVKNSLDDAGKKLAAVREPLTDAKAPAQRPGELLGAKGQPATVVPFEDPLGYVRAFAPGEFRLENPGDTFHRVGRAFRLYSKDRELTVSVEAEFIGSDAPNPPQTTLAWVVRKVYHGAEDTISRPRFSRPVPGADAADSRQDMPNGVARRTKVILVKRWAYVAGASGPRAEVAAADVDAFFDSFAVTDKALAHPEGGGRR